MREGYRNCSRCVFRETDMNPLRMPHLQYLSIHGFILVIDFC